MTSVSVVVPVFNEEGSIKELFYEIKKVCEKENYDYEIVFVNDGSSDQTGVVCKSLKPVKYVELRRNFGQTAAMDAGIHVATKEYIITMDGDLQNDPADIPRLIDYLEKNDLDVVSGWRKHRRDSFAKKIISRGANLLRKIIVKDHIHDSGCSLKIYRKECFRGLTLYGEQHRFIPALLEMRGFKVGEIVVNHRSRASGDSKYNWKRTIKGFVDMVSVWFWNRYASRPLHLLGTTGILFFLLGIICGVWSVALFVLGYKMSNNIMPPLLTVFFIVLGILMFIFGLMSEAIMKVYFNTGSEDYNKAYSIKEIVNNE